MRRLVAAALGVASAALVVTGLAPPAEAAPGPRAASTRTATATPGSELANEVVRVSWTGFTPTLANGLNGVIVLQCSAAPTKLADCDTAEAFPAVTNGNRGQATTGPDGTGSTLFEVRPAAFLPTLGCSTVKPCSLLVYENDGVPFEADELPVNRALAPLAFARSQADCPQVFDFDIRADGSSTAAPLFYSWAGDLCLGDDSLVLDYTETSSTSGRENFLNGLVDLGVTAVAASEEEIEAHPSHADFSYAPVAASAQVVAYNLRDPLTGERLDDIVLSPRLVARLVTNTSTDTFFKDRELIRLNPGVRFPTGGATRPLLRAERSASTTIYTSWLAADPDVQSFLTGDDIFRVDVNSAYDGYTYPKELFENVSGDTAYLARQGQRAVALRLFYGVSPTGVQRENTAFNGVIGLVDLPTAQRFGLQVARLKKADGTIVGPTTEAIEAGLADMEVDEHGVLVNDPTPEDPASYPLVRVDYAMVPSRVDDQATRSDLVRVLEHAVGPGQDGLPDGYVPLPADLRDATREVAAGIEAPVATTTTTVAPTTTNPASTTTRPPRTTTTTQPPALTTTIATIATTFPVATTSPPFVTPTTGATTTSPATSVPSSSTSRPRRTTTTGAPDTTLPASTTSSSIVPPEPQPVLPSEPTARPERVVTGMAGLSAAAMIGTISPERLKRLRLRRRKS